jgi:hypothetical protein
MIVEPGVVLEEAEGIALKSLEEFTEEEKEFYDFNFTLKQNANEKSEGFVISGAKNKNGTKLIWNNNTPVEKEEASAPAKFDLSKTPDEYKAALLGDRSYDDLMPNEKRELSSEVAAYRIEWTRINDPEAWWRMRRPLIPGNEIRSEQEKIRSSRGSAIRR